MNIFFQIVSRIIKEQELIIGPIAWDEAKKVQGLRVDITRKEIAIVNGEKEVIEKLVRQYERLFGRASIEACREAVQDIIPEIPPEKVPAVLK